MLQVSIGNPAHTKLQNCKEFFNDGSLKRAWDDFQVSEMSTTMHSDPRGKKIINIFTKKRHNRISGRDPVMVIEEYVNWQKPQLVITAHKLEDAIKRKHRRVSY